MFDDPVRKLDDLGLATDRGRRKACNTETRGVADTALERRVYEQDHRNIENAADQQNEHGCNEGEFDRACAALIATQTTRRDDGTRDVPTLSEMGEPRDGHGWLRTLFPVRRCRPDALNEG